MGMIHLSQETEALAERLAAAQSLSVDAAIQRALETHARVAGIDPMSSSRRRMIVEQMLAFGAEIAAMPILDRRSPNEIMDDLNSAWSSSIARR
jgi:antitoxin VapB